jgi:hypothetical protein
MTEQEGRPGAGKDLASAEREAAAEAAAESSGEPPVETHDDAEAEPGSELTAEPQGSAGSPTTGSSSSGPSQLEAVVRAAHVDLRQGGAQQIDAETVSMTQGGASRINARNVTITMGGAALVRSDTVRLEEGSGAFSVFASRAHVSPGSRVAVLIARESSGEVRPVLDWRAALALVAGYVLFRRLIGGRRGR